MVEPYIDVNGQTGLKVNMMASSVGLGLNLKLLVSFNISGVLY